MTQPRRVALAILILSVLGATALWFLGTAPSPAPGIIDRSDASQARAAQNALLELGPAALPHLAERLRTAAQGEADPNGVLALFRAMGSQATDAIPSLVTFVETCKAQHKVAALDLISTLVLDAGPDGR